MLDKKSFFMAIGLVTGSLVLNNVNAANFSDQPLAMGGLKRQEQKVSTNADTTLRDAESAYTQARHILLEDKNNPRVPDPDVKRLKILINQAASNLERSREIAGRIEGLKFEV